MRKTKRRKQFDEGGGGKGMRMTVLLVVGWSACTGEEVKQSSLPASSSGTRMTRAESILTRRCLSLPPVESSLQILPARCMVNGASDLNPWWWLWWGYWWWW